MSNRYLLPNITAKGTVKFGNEAWAMKNRGTERLDAAQMSFLRCLLGITRLQHKKIRKKVEIKHSKYYVKLRTNKELMTTHTQNENKNGIWKKILGRRYSEFTKN
jgi:hypothetical protein